MDNPKFVLLKLTEEEKAQIRAKADDLHLPLTRYIRMAALFWRPWLNE
ncbi:MAG: hypothetical protein QW478_12340 [Candidatus Micrarchaeaceae archaeon]